ncbi:SPFH domain-containing protein [Anaerosporobacter sp.]|uniref:SPFH domain-containing protein n=1 Tax=Anaerosporobacter sp. TaxID=1872529 RepID=UPI00286F0E88|nr:SPFH domain-containing protein [Anaerosporobacter sp.]
MAKFAIECSACGRYAEAKTGFFARKKIDCACGNVINVNIDKFSSRECPHCGNQIVFNQEKGADATCPICHEKINTLAEQQQTKEFFCAQCNVRLMTARSATTYVCPVCDYVNDVQERLEAERIKKDGIASIIKYEGNNETLVWKHPIEDFNFGSQLIVHESQEAIFFKDGQALDLFKAGRYTLETQQLPLIENIYNLPTNTEGTFHSEIYYINMTTQMGIKWGTDSKVRLFDPTSGIHVELGASGEFNVRVSNSRKLLLKVVGTAGSLGQSQLIDDGNLKGYFRTMVITQVKSYLAQTIKDNQINILEIDSDLMRLSTALRDKINTYLDDYGLIMPEFFVGRIMTPDDDPNFRKMKEQYAEQYLLVRQEQIRKSEAEAAAQRKEVEATTAARMKIIGAQGDVEVLKLKALAEAEAYKVQAEVEAMEMKMKGYTYQQETSRQVGLEAMKNGLTGGTGSAGTSVIGDLAGLGIGLGTMGSMVNMTKDAISPMLENSVQMGQAVSNTMQGAWDCLCGQKGIVGKFCMNCGTPKPHSIRTDIWDCSCGQKDNTGNFCANCGTRKPEEAMDTWDCSCGKTGMEGKYCNNCGKRRDE